jgi:signal transduction histidine kinase/ligand-binding sensor domain-containing protein
MNLQKKLILFINFLLLISCVLSDANGIYDKDHIFQIENNSVIKTENSLRAVTVITQDSRGQIWLGSNKGLIKYDLKHSKLYNIDNNNIWVTSMINFDSKRLLVGTKKGLFLFNIDTGEFYNNIIDEENGLLSSADIRAISKSIDGKIWIATSSRIFSYFVENKKYTEFNIWQGFNGRRKFPEITSLFSSRDGDLWVTYQNGVAKIPLGKNNVYHTQIFKYKNKKINKEKVFPSTVTVSMDGNILIGTNLGLGQIENSKKNEDFYVRLGIFPEIGNKDIAKLLHTSNDDIWVSIYNSGLFLKKKDDLIFSNKNIRAFPKEEVCDANIEDIFEAEGGIIWVGGWERQPCFINSNDIGFYTLKRRERLGEFSILNEIKSISEYDGNILFLTMRGDVYKHNFKADVDLYRIPISRSIKKFLKFKNDFWVIDSNGVGKFNPENKKIKYSCKFKNNFQTYVNSMTVDIEGDIWFSTAEGIFSCQVKKSRIIEFKDNGEFNFFKIKNEVYPIVSDKSNNIWMGTPQGLQRYDKRQKKFFFYDQLRYLKNLIFIGQVNSIKFADNENMWIGTSLGLIKLFNPASGSIFIEKLYDFSEIYAIEIDVDGNIWGSVPGGLIKLNPYTEFIEIFDAIHGIEGGVFSGVESYMDKNGDIYFSNSNGVTYFSPRKIKPITLKPNLVISELKIECQSDSNNNKTFILNAEDVGKKAIFPKDVYSLFIRFSDLNFAREKIKNIEIKLEGFDKDWHRIDPSDMTFSYFNLKDGDFILKIRSTYSGNIQKEEMEVLKFQIPSPIWKFWWIQTLLTLFLIILLVAFHKIKIKNFKKNSDRLENIIQARTFQLEEQSKNKSKFIADAAHDLRQPIQAIGNLLEASVKAFERNDYVKSKELVFLAKKAANIMRHSFHSVLELSRVETRMMNPRYESIYIHGFVQELIKTIRLTENFDRIAINYIPSKVEELYVLSDRSFLNRILSNLIINSIKHHDENKSFRKITVRCCLIKKSIFRIYILDNGRGIPESEFENIFKPFYQIGNFESVREKGIGLGLSIVDAMCKALENHVLSLNSKLGVGTKISIDLPISSSVSSNDTFSLCNDTSDQKRCAGLFVLYIEDDELVRKSTTIVLTSVEIICESFSSFEELRDRIEFLERIPDIILTDHRLPNGYTSSEVIEVIRNKFEYKVPAIILTGEGLDVNEKNIDVFEKILIKPITVEKIISEIVDLNHLMASF